MPTLVVRSSKGKGEKKTENVEFSEATTVREIKLALLKRYVRRAPVSIFAGKHNCAVLKLTFPDGTSVPLADNSLTIREMVAQESFAGAVVDFKYVGPQISYRGVFIIEYLGPLLIMLALFSRPAIVYGEGASDQPVHPLAKTAVLLWSAHFVKRELETLFVHKFSRETMPLSNLFKNSAHYWSAALYIGWPLCSPSFEAPAFIVDHYQWLPYFLIPAFAAGQFVNFAAHLYFAQTRKADGDQHRPMPSGPLFAFVYVVFPLSSVSYVCSLLSALCLDCLCVL